MFMRLSIILFGVILFNICAFFLPILEYHEHMISLNDIYKIEGFNQTFLKHFLFSTVMLSIGIYFIIKQIINTVIQKQRKRN